MKPNEGGKQAQERGKQAEQRFLSIAQAMLGITVRGATPEEDYGGKTDALVNGIPIQISVSQKSKGERDRLAKRGIANIAAGETTSTEQIRQKIKDVIDKSK